MSIVKRINFLTSNPEKARVKVPYGIEPNCFGTSLWVLEYDKGLENVWRNMCLTKEYSEANGNGVFVSLPKEDIPGYVGHTPMDLFLENPNYFDLALNPALGSLLTVWYKDPNDELCGFIIRHSGIVIEENRVFEKEDLKRGIKKNRSIDEVIADVPSKAEDIQIRIYRPLQAKFS